MKLRLVGKRLVLVMVTFVVTFLVVEGLVRVILPSWAPRTARITRFWRHDPRYGWAHVPDMSGRFESHGIDAMVTINEKGFRGPVLPYARTPGKKRVVVLGDSMVWGFGVGDDEVFTELIAERMPKVEIVNLGVSGYSTDQELLLYQDEGVKYGADLVVLVMIDNDPPGNMLKVQYVTYGKPVFVLEDGKLRLENVPVPEAPWTTRALANLAMRSYILNGLNRYRYALAHKGTQEPEPPEQDPRPFPRTEAQEITVRLVLELQREVTANGSRFLVVYTDGMGKLGRAFADYLGPRGVSSVQIGDFLDPSDAKLHLPDGFHWNAEAHRVVSEHLSGILVPHLQ